MFSTNDYDLGSSAPFASPVGVQLRRIPIDEHWPVAPETVAERVLDDWLPQRRDARQRLQASIDGIDSQLVLLDRDGNITLVNRAWRLSADVQDPALSQHGIGLNYLNLCHSAAARGCRDAVHTAEGIDAVLTNRWRSFSYKYAWTCDHERRLYLLHARRFINDVTTYVAVTHQLLECHAVSAAERATSEYDRATIES